MVGRVNVILGSLGHWEACHIVAPNIHTGPYLINSFKSARRSRSLEAIIGYPGISSSVVRNSLGGIVETANPRTPSHQMDSVNVR